MIKDFNALLTLDLQYFATDGESEVLPNASETNPNGQESAETNLESSENAVEQSKTYTQAEINDMIAKRIERERKKFADYEEIKTKATEYEKALEEKRLAELSEKERAEELAKKYEAEKQELAAQLEAIRTQAQQERIRNEFIKVATSANIAYIDDAIALADLSAVSFDEDGKVVGVNDVVKALVENKPFLVAKKPTQPIGTATNAGTAAYHDKSAEQLLAEAAELARTSGKISDKVNYAKLKKQLGK